MQRSPAVGGDRLDHRGKPAGRLMFLGVETRFDNVRSDPRYAELVRRLGFPS